MKDDVMKFEDYKFGPFKGIDKKTLRALEQIAMDNDCLLAERGGIEVRGNDEEDFFDAGVFSIEAMLVEAYKLGKAEAVK